MRLDDSSLMRLLMSVRTKLAAVMFSLLALSVGRGLPAAVLAERGGAGVLSATRQEPLSPEEEKPGEAGISSLADGRGNLQ